MHCAETGFSEYHRPALNPASVPTPLPVQAEVAQQCDPGPGGLGPCKLPTNGWDETLCPQKVGSRSQPCGHLPKSAPSPQAPSWLLGENVWQPQAYSASGMPLRFQGSPLGPRDTLNWVFVPCTAQVMGRGLRERVPAWLLAAGWPGGLSRPIELCTCERWALTAPPPAPVTFSR